MLRTGSLSPKHTPKGRILASEIFPAYISHSKKFICGRRNVDRWEQHKRLSATSITTHDFTRPGWMFMLLIQKGFWVAWKLFRVSFRLLFRRTEEQIYMSYFRRGIREVKLASVPFAPSIPLVKVRGAIFVITCLGTLLSSRQVTALVSKIWALKPSLERSGC